MALLNVFLQMVESYAGEFPLVTPGDVVDLVEGMEDLYIMGTVNGFQKVTKIEGLQDMASLTVSYQWCLEGQDRRGGGGGRVQGSHYLLFVGAKSCPLSCIPVGGIAVAMFPLVAGGGRPLMRRRSLHMELLVYMRRLELRGLGGSVRFWLGGALDRCGRHLPRSTLSLLICGLALPVAAAVCCSCRL